MGFWLLVLIISTVIIAYKVYMLRRDYEETIAELKTDVQSNIRDQEQVSGIIR